MRRPFAREDQPATELQLTVGVSGSMAEMLAAACILSPLTSATCWGRCTNAMNDSTAAPKLQKPVPTPHQVRGMLFRIML
jgi:hypothetical protein